MVGGTLSLGYQKTELLNLTIVCIERTLLLGVFVLLTVRPIYWISREKYPLFSAGLCLLREDVNNRLS
ncbi:hypothetical protein JOC85_001974 [Bacillus mesophilus]|nr:hypothetical protein [Bacillus mesophilus]